MVRRASALPAYPALMTAATLFTHVASPVGPLLLTADAGSPALTRVHFGARRDAGWIEDAAAFGEAERQLAAYFAGELTVFELPLAPRGSPFQLAVWREIAAIPYGHTISYGELARRTGDVSAARAAGLAAGANPLAIVVPCHRVIGASGKLTGFGGGLPIKARLLALERGERELDLFGPPEASAL